MISLGILTGLVSMLCWGIGDFILSIPARKIGTLKTMMANSILTLIILVPIMIYGYKTNQISISQINILILLLAAILNSLAIYNYLKSLELGEVSIVSPVSAAYPIITVTLSIIFLKESLSIIKIISVFTIVMGMILSSTDLKKIAHIHTVNGIPNAFLSMIFFGLFFFILGLIAKQINYLTLFIFSAGFAAVLFLLFSLFNKVEINLLDFKNREISLSLFLNSIVSTIAWFVFNYGLTVDLVSLVVAVSSLYPAIIVILGIIFYKEKLLQNQKIGITAILIGLFLISI